MNNPKYIYFNSSESLLSSVCKDIVSFSFLAFCIYISQGSTFWTFLTGSIFILLSGAKIKLIYDKRSRPFKSKSDLLEFVKGLPDD